MTSELKCPVCQNNLHKINLVVSTCTNDKCSLWGSSIPNLVLEALIQAKQDLETAKADIEDYKKYKALWEQIRNNTILELEHKLEIARKALESISGVRGNIEDYYGGVSIHYQQMVLHMDEIATNALEQIDHIADVGKMVGQN